MKRFLILALASAALAGPAAAADYAPAMPMFSWSGVYGGVDIGYGWGEQDVSSDDIILNFDDTDPLNPIFDVYPGFNGSLDLDGVVGGIYGGANFQAGGFVFGFDADYTWSGMTSDNISSDDYIIGAGGATPVSGSFGKADMDLTWLAHIRGRLGYGWDRFMIYAAGGLALAGISSNGGFDTPGDDVVANFNSGGDTVTGWTVGGGVEWAVTDSVIVRAEYLYDQFDDVDFGSYSVDSLDLTDPLNPIVVDSGSSKMEGDLSANIFRVGVSWKFGGMF